jgi:predicted MFS family arabinose efflux permease
VGLTIGLLMAVTLAALESLTVLSVMPLVAADLDGLSLYGWVFGAFFVSSALAIPIAARTIDRSGLRRPFAVGLGLFGGGLLIAGFAPAMLVLVGGRVLQGVGAGTLNAVTYAAIAIAYGPRERARILALVSTAWLVPAFVGPVLGSAIAAVAGWRWTFLGLAAFVPIVAVLVLPAVASHDRRRDPTPRLQESWAKTLIPAREIGRAAVVSMLGGSAIYGAITFAPLAMTAVRGQPTIDAGLAIGFCSAAWIAASWVHQRWMRRVDLRDAIRLGLGFITVTSLILVGVVLPEVPYAVIVIGWILVGLGCGVAFQAINLFVMGRASPGTEGRATSSVQLANTVGAAVGTTALGGLFNLGRDAGLAMASSLVLVLAVCWAVLALSTMLAWGTPPARDSQADTAGA